MHLVRSCPHVFADLHVRLTCSIISAAWMQAKAAPAKLHRWLFMCPEALIIEWLPKEWVQLPETELFAQAAELEPTEHITHIAYAARTSLSYL